MTPRLQENPGRPSRTRRPSLVPVTREPIFDAEAFKRVCGRLGWTRRALHERSGISLATIDALRSGRTVPSDATSFRLALALPEEDLREVFGGDPQAQRPAQRRGYDRKLDRVLRVSEPVELGDGRRVRSGIYQYGPNGRPTLRVYVDIGRRSVLVARVAVQDAALGAHLVGLIADAVFPEPANEPLQRGEVAR